MMRNLEFFQWHQGISHFAWSQKNLSFGVKINSLEVFWKMQLQLLSSEQDHHHHTVKKKIKKNRLKRCQISRSLAVKIFLSLSLCQRCVKKINIFNKNFHIILNLAKTSHEFENLLSGRLLNVFVYEKKILSLVRFSRIFQFFMWRGSF